MTAIQERLFALQDTDYAAFQRPLMPTVEEEAFIGVRTPALRSLAKELKGSDEANAFLKQLPHTYFDENQLHAFLISLEKDFDTALAQTDVFLPCINNWATCDQLSPKAFRKNKAALRASIDAWLLSPHEYTVRFGMGMLMEHFLDEDFTPEVLEAAASVRRGEYYIRMMQAWFFATALAKQYEAALPYLQQDRLDEWTHNKTIQKAVESYRVKPEQKAYLKTLRRKAKRR
jgi:3-methyladenine DNA glycosylase AlkD